MRAAPRASRLRVDVGPYDEEAGLLGADSRREQRQGKVRARRGATSDPASRPPSPPPHEARPSPPPGCGLTRRRPARRPGAGASG